MILHLNKSQVHTLYAALTVFIGESETIIHQNTFISDEPAQVDNLLEVIYLNTDAAELVKKFEDFIIENK